MTNTAAPPNRNGVSAQPPREQVSLGSYTADAATHSVVDHLTDHHFAIPTMQIIGNDLRVVEQLTGPRYEDTRIVLADAAR